MIEYSRQLRVLCINEVVPWNAIVLARILSIYGLTVYLLLWKAKAQAAKA